MAGIDLLRSSSINGFSTRAEPAGGRLRVALRGELDLAGVGLVERMQPIFDVTAPGERPDIVDDLK
jgi:hypothetical protein